jgi:hypothetical protein
MHEFAVLLRLVSEASKRKAPGSLSENQGPFVVAIVVLVSSFCRAVAAIVRRVLRRSYHRLTVPCRSSV